MMLSYSGSKVGGSADCPQQAYALMGEWDCHDMVRGAAVGELVWSERSISGMVDDGAKRRAGRSMASPNEIGPSPQPPPKTSTNTTTNFTWPSY